MAGLHYSMVKIFDGWRQVNGTAMPANWVIEDNAMKVFTAQGKKPGQGANGDIIYANKKYKNFELSVDWKTVNVYSGIKRQILNSKSLSFLPYLCGLKNKFY